MPTYEYACTACTHEWEFEQSIKDSALTECPECHGQTARRQISRGTGFILKGSGWYSDLYSSSSNKPKADESKSPAPKGDAKSESKSESKSDASSKESSGSETKSESKKTDTGGAAKKGDAAAA